MALEEAGGPSYREHAALNERVTRLEAGLGHLPAEVARLSRGSEQQAAALHELTRAIHDIGRQPTTDPAIAQLALGLHAFADAMKSQASQPAKTAPVQLPTSFSGVLMVAGAIFVLGGLTFRAMPIAQFFGGS